MDKYSSYSLPELREELRKRGARVSGRKKELIERILAYDRNADFGKERLEPEYTMKLPSHEDFRDINSDTKFPEITKASIDMYLKNQGKTIDSNIDYLYRNRFLKYLRTVKDVNTCKYFFKSECKAQMKKSGSYCVDVCSDQNGSIVECQCECAVGMGPSAHCKHVCVVLLALQKFSSCSQLMTEETCTQKLQTFHRVKTFHGSPMKVSDLPLANENNEVNFDPRPRKFRKMQGYADLFRNTWLNHSKVNEYPVSQLYAVANTHALDVDHDYGVKKLSDIWLDKMNITSITPSEISQFEFATRGQGKSIIWNEDRRKRIHSSNFGRICKSTEKTDFHKLACSLTKVSNEINVPSISHGKAYESVALKQFEKETLMKTDPCGTFISESHPYIAATPDALIGTDTVVEVKCPFSAREVKVSPDSVQYLNLYNGELVLDQSHNYYFQIQGQLFCTGRRNCIFIVYTFKGIEIIKIKRNEEFISKMVEKLSYFFNNHFREAVLERFFFKNYYSYNFS